MAAVGLLVVSGAAVWLWAYPWWVRRNVVSISRQWLDAGRWDLAAGVVQRREFILTTKIGPTDTADEFRRALDDSMQRMGVDYVQGYAIARPKPMTGDYFAATQDNQLPHWCGALVMG